MNRHQHTSWIEIDLNAIRHNLRNLKKAAEPANVLAVVKSEAYGHGLEEIAQTVWEEGVWGMGIVSIAEGKRIRKLGINCPLVMIAPILPAQMDQAILNDMSPAVFDYEFAEELSRRSVALGRVTKVHIKVDTGMGRLSVDADKTVEFALKAAKLPGLKIEGLYSHLAAADSLDQSYTQLQYRRFASCVKQLEEAGLHIPVKHLAASAGMILLSAPRYDLTRAGIAMYGLWPSPEVKMIVASRNGSLNDLANAQVTGDPETDAAGTEAFRNNPAADFLRPALSFKTSVMQVKMLKAGSCISYGCTFMCHRETKIAVLPIGYADGYDRRLSNVGEVLIHGARAPIVGRICMNICMVDVTDIPDVKVGDEAVLLGSQQGATITAEEIAAKIGTINYEVVTRLPMHIPRIYLGKTVLHKGQKPQPTRG